MKYQPIFHTLYFKNSACVLNNIILTTIIEVVETLDGRIHSVERVRYVIYSLGIVKYEVLFHADPCNRYYI